MRNEPRSFMYDIEKTCGKSGRSFAKYAGHQGEPVRVAARTSKIVTRENVYFAHAINVHVGGLFIYIHICTYIHGTSEGFIYMKGK